ncbi:DUF348 domain-containing protein [Romboutsia maritimum]|uniref:DUF348 domain-containing protein n=1 Tax=Romboutsia maritimum TaxID=2020948 RepID=A0A371IUR5_9FIRM|nr:3D domain-containing protein [Romboutsia maritimum]RDY24218.1 DUF348 domain-containing protein [Romboutsia maritimum]
MEFKRKNIIVSILMGVFVLTIFLTGYKILNKEQITLTVKGEDKKVSTFKTTVKELLDEKNINYSEEDKITPKLNTKLKDKMDIKIVKVLKEEKKEYEEIPFEVSLKEDKNLIKGQTEIENEGKVGKKEKVYKLIYNDGKLVEKNLSKEIISEEPVDKVVRKGIKEEIMVASREVTSRNNNSKNNGSNLSVVATAYAGDTITSTGTTPRWGVIAVDPRVIPYGSRVYIPEFNMTFIAEDCGGAIKGNRIDIFMNSENQAYSWGRRTVSVNVQN